MKPSKNNLRKIDQNRHQITSNRYKKKLQKQMTGEMSENREIQSKIDKMTRKWLKMIRNYSKMGKNDQKVQKITINS